MQRYVVPRYGTKADAKFVIAMENSFVSARNVVVHPRTPERLQRRRVPFPSAFTVA